MTEASFGKYQAYGKYRVVEKIGAGGFGEVFKGLDPFLNRPVAIKTCSSAEEEMRRRFFREAEIAANLQHPNIVTVFDFGYQDEKPYLVQEFLSGEDLDHKIRRREPADIATKLDYLLHIAKGLEYAHSRAVVHRDVKPANVRVLDDGQIRIMDFGIAKLLTAETQLTRTGMALGTAAYLPPEQITGGEVGPRADLFSYGVLAYELMTWERPFAGASLSAMLYAIAHTEPAPLAGRGAVCPPRLAALIETCLAKDPESRQPGFAEVIAELESLSAMPAIPPVPPLPVPLAASPTAVTAAPLLDPTRQTIATPITAAREAGIRKGRIVTYALLGVAAAGMLAVAGLGAWWLSRAPGGALPAPGPAPAAAEPREEPGARTAPTTVAKDAERPVAGEVRDGVDETVEPTPEPSIAPPAAVSRPPADPQTPAPRRPSKAPAAATPPPAPVPAPLIVARPRGTEMGRLADGERAYADRDLTYRDVPWTYRQLPCLRTSNDLKHAAASLSITLGRGAEVFVAHDLRIKDKPEWLASFTDTGLAVKVAGDDDDGKEKYYQIFVKDLPPGEIELGPNLPASAQQERVSMYTVFFRPR